jgi:carboxypeptidase family protein
MSFLNSRAVRTLVVVGLVLTSAVAHADRRRPARPGGPAATPRVSFSGKVTDAQSGAGIFAAEITIQGRVIHADQSGNFTLSDLAAGSTLVEVGRWGYSSKTQTVDLNRVENSLNFALQPRPIVNVTNASGAVLPLDLDSSRFEFYFPLASAQKLDVLPFCKTDGTTINVEATNIRSIVGPGTIVGQNSCCPTGDSIRVTLTLKSGESFEGLLAECQYYRIVFTGRDRRDGRWHQFRFTEFGRIEFP